MSGSPPALVVMLLASPSPYAELSIGGGVESNVNHANTAAEEQAAAYGDLSAVAGLSAYGSDAPERPEASQQRRRGRPVMTFGEEVLATKELATIHSLLASVTFSTSWGLYASGGYTGSYVGAIGSQSYVDHLVALRIGYLLTDADG